jgi:ABC-2 type transport system ATP-binding protein
MIETSGLTKNYGSHTAVKSLTLNVKAGEVFGFLGPNGAGKSTTIRMLCGLLNPTSGVARVAGFDISDEPVEVKKRIGYLAEEPFVYEKLTGREFLSFIGDLYGLDRASAQVEADRLFELFDLTDKVGEIAENYSHGMRQKLALSGTLIHDPEVLFLDEPTNGLDPRSARIVKELLMKLAERGRTVFLSTHILEIAEHMCDRVGIINEGELIAVGSLQELRRKAKAGEASLEDIFLDLTGGPEIAELATYLSASPT